MSYKLEFFHPQDTGVQLLKNLTLFIIK